MYYTYIAAYGDKNAPFGIGILDKLIINLFGLDMLNLSTMSCGSWWAFNNLLKTSANHSAVMITKQDYTI